MRLDKISSFDFLKRQLARLRDDPSESWTLFPCLEWPRAKRGNGYGSVFAWGSGKPAHRVAYELTFGPIPDSLWVLHHCDNPPCFRPSHLFLGTNADNQQDCVRKGRANRRHGELHTRAKVTDAQVAEIRMACAAGMTQTAVAIGYGMDPSAVCNIVNGRRRKRATDFSSAEMGAAR